MPELETQVALVQQDIKYIKEKIDNIMDSLKDNLDPICKWKIEHETKHDTLNKVGVALWVVGTTLAGGIVWGLERFLGK